ncbi:hypothetical protein GTN30_12660 (plasmid) [Macrococcoides canis]|uniref:Uncharacterized protein n=1 Tax=Macrococcoides canis TaxID=1855823 RepID=A0AAE6X2S9_9STAP|nr:hypothetical protein [Macrococcus canis]QIH79471.1 hypothetical protein GTN30_12660 [Macrococcus canis]
MTVLQTIIDEVTENYRLTRSETDLIEISASTKEDIDAAITELNKRDNFEFKLQKYNDSIPTLIRYTLMADKQSYVMRQKLADDLNELASYLKHYETYKTPASIKHTTEHDSDTYIIDIKGAQTITITFK